MTFLDFAHAHGVEIDPARLTPSRRIRRCGTEDKPRSQNGAYFWDGQRGWVFRWDADAQVHWYHDPHAPPWTAAEKAQLRERRRVAQEDQLRRQQRAATHAQELLSRATPASHSYLSIKGFPDAEGLVLDDALLIPMRDVNTNELLGVQSVRWVEAERRHDKKMTAGMRAKGAVLRLGRSAVESVLVEGSATGLSVQAALRMVGLQSAVVVCFSAGNLVHVAPQIRGRRVVFADNDASGTGERAAQATELPYCMSPVIGEDANDLHRRDGLLAVAKKILEARMKS